MIQYINHLPNWDQIENYLLTHQDKTIVTTRYTYWFKQVGDCAGIFRRKNKKNAEDELIAYYHEGEI